MTIINLLYPFAELQTGKAIIKKEKLILLFLPVNIINALLWCCHDL